MTRPPQRAHWLRRDLLAWRPHPTADSYRLHWSAAADLTPRGREPGGRSVPLLMPSDPAPPGRPMLPEDVLARFPHLATCRPLRLPGDILAEVPEILRGQAAVAAYSGDDLVDVAGLQIAGVLDDVYADPVGPLGVSWAGGAPTIRVWAPTARTVELLVGQDAVAMTRSDDGVWTAYGRPSWRGARYRFAVIVYAPTVGAVVRNEVTDPYSLGLTTNSKWSVMVDLDAPELKPPGWDELRPPTLEHPVDRTIYELHIRDFSIGDETVPEPERGTYLAFTRDGAGMRHLRRLAAAGLNTVHLLPAFDIATIEEERAAQAEPDGDLSALPPDSPEQQRRIEAVRHRDGFNWGYDPFHYSTPEGSYATEPDGVGRTLEFRRMVQALNDAGLQVVMDVVYNHTAAHGQDPRSVLDRVVPGYYHRLDAQGRVEDSTCCSNTAAEHRMMERLVVDSVLTWVRHYRVNGFRFDLMGHHPKAMMLRLRQALDELTLDRDGIDGRAVYLYGEGWDFGEVAGGARFEQAGQLDLAGTGIGTFSDRLRDAVRGGGAFERDPRQQGFGSGLLTDPNGARINGGRRRQAAALAHAEDLVKLGLAGNLRDFAFLSSRGGQTHGALVDYHGAPAGYADEPAETVSYVDAHDNETLYDELAYKLPRDTPMRDRVRMNTLALATVTLGQGVVFWHAGTDLLRSKSMDRNSYDSGDWFNRIDWTGRESTFGSGLPPRADNAARWRYMEPLLADPALRPGPDDIAAATAAAQDLLRLRSSTRLLRLGSAAAIRAKVSFLPTAPGVIAMLIDDCAGPEPADAGVARLLTVFNATPAETAVAVQPAPTDLMAADPMAATAESSSLPWRLHPVQQHGRDDVVRRTSITHPNPTDPTTSFTSVTVPARTVAVLLQPRANSG